MHVEVRDPSDRVVLSRVYSSEGMISFTSNNPGEHVICMYSNSTSWFSGSQLRVHLDIQVGEHAVDYANVAQKDKLTELQLRIRQLLDQVHQITKEQSYQRCGLSNLNGDPREGPPLTETTEDQCCAMHQRDLCRQTLNKFNGADTNAVFYIVTGDESWIYFYESGTKKTISTVCVSFRGLAN
nr:transmembrane emp24 domain-containing protein eca-like [Danaus plexippus plexippus]